MLRRVWFYAAHSSCHSHYILGPCVYDTDSSPLSKVLRSVTVIYLYTYPTLLMSLIPLLNRLTGLGHVRAIVTLTYHLPGDVATCEKRDEQHDLQLYSRFLSKAKT